jgi:hypothetical protein
MLACVKEPHFVNSFQFRRVLEEMHSLGKINSAGGKKTGIVRNRNRNSMAYTNAFTSTV